VSTRLETVRFFADQLARCDAGEITFKKMFGEYGVYANGLMFALACDDRLFFKVKHLEASVVDGLFGNREEPYPGAKGYAEVSGDIVEDVGALEQRLRTVLATLPVSKPKRKKG
jgi:hypothetical protein